MEYCCVGVKGYREIAEAFWLENVPRNGKIREIEKEKKGQRERERKKEGQRETEREEKESIYPDLPLCSNIASLINIPREFV